MNVYLLIDKETGKLIKVYKYEEVALMEADRVGIRDSVMGAFSGITTSKFRVEVVKVVE